MCRWDIGPDDTLACLAIVRDLVTLVLLGEHAPKEEHQMVLPPRHVL